MEITKEEFKSIVENIFEEKAKLLLEKYEKKDEGSQIIIPEKKEELKPDTKEYINDIFKSILSGKVKKDILWGTDASGGYAIPTTMAEEIIRVAIGESIFLQRARAYLEPSGRMDIPGLDFTNFSVANGFWGGVYVYSITEGSNITESQPTWYKVALSAKDYGAYMEVSRKFLTARGINTTSDFATMLTQAIGYYVDYKCINGAGTTEPLGILNSSAAIGVTRATANQVQIEDLTGMLSVFLNSPNQNGKCFIVHQTTYKYLYSMTGGTNALLFINPNTGALSNIFGIPIYQSWACSPLGTPGDVILADLSYYGLLLQDNIRIEESNDYKFQADMKAIKLVLGFDGQPLCNSKVTIAGSTYVSPFVYLN